MKILSEGAMAPCNMVQETGQLLPALPLRAAAGLNSPDVRVHVRTARLACVRKQKWR